MNSRFPEVGNRYERRDSLFYEKTPTTAEAAASLLAFLPPKPVSTPMSTSSTGSSSATTLTSTSTVTEASKDAALSSIAVSSSALLVKILKPYAYVLLNLENCFFFVKAEAFSYEFQKRVKKLIFQANIGTVEETSATGTKKMVIEKKRANCSTSLRYL